MFVSSLLFFVGLECLISDDEVKTVITKTGSVTAVTDPLMRFVETTYYFTCPLLFTLCLYLFKRSDFKRLVFLFFDDLKTSVCECDTRNRSNI